MTAEQKNRYVAEKLGLCWHEWKHYFDTNLEESRYKCALCDSWVEREYHPDFSTPAGTVMLLELMMKRDGFGDYLSYLARINFNQCLGAVIPVGYITTPGKLLEAVVEWFKGREQDLEFKGLPGATLNEGRPINAKYK